VQELFVFFTSSTGRYNLLKTKLASKGLLMPKRLSDTRWSAHTDATKALMCGYSDIKEVLNSIANNADAKGDVCNTATGLYDKMCRLETGIFAVVWNVILERFNTTSKQLQDETTDLNTAVYLLQSLEAFVQSRCAIDSTSLDKEGRILLEEYTKQHQRTRRRNVPLNPLDYEYGAEVQRTHKNEFKGDCFLPVIDMLLSSLANRISAYKDVCNRFGFLRQLAALSIDDINKHAQNLVQMYPTDLEECLGSELIQFRTFVELRMD